jgi:glutathione S-transferase
MIGTVSSPPRSIDSVLDKSSPPFSNEKPTFFRERHGWCPYSERVWLALELKSVRYDTIRIDNTGGARPPYFTGQTPQLRWPDGRTQGESMDLIAVMDADVNYGERYSLRTNDPQVHDAIQAFRRTFPRGARPSSRAAFLFQANGDPLSRSVFQETLAGTEQLLSLTSSTGPFLCGNQPTAADICWAPFLERYRYQLPCLHQGLEPFDPSVYPNLYQWYQAMDSVPDYVCRVKGDASSWRKVLVMAGFGNGGVPPNILANIETQPQTNLSTILNLDVWTRYAASRPYVAKTPHAHAAMVVMHNKEAIVKDVMKQQQGLGMRESELDDAMRALVLALIEGGTSTVTSAGVGRLAAFLDQRMCVPRDMGAMPAAAIKQLAVAWTQLDDYR